MPQTGGSFYSDVRDEAIALNALLDADPEMPDRYYGKTCKR